MLKKILFAIFPLYLAACATTPVYNTRIDKNAELTTGHGVVALQVVNNTERLAPLHRNWTEVMVVRLDNMEQIKTQAIAAAKAKAQTEKKKFDPEKVDWMPELYNLLPSNEGVVSSQLFVGSMPDGTYMISRLYAYYNDGNMSSWIQMPVRGSAGTFQVVSGKMTNLGTVVFQPLLDVKAESFWSSGSSKKAFVTRLPEPELYRFALDSYPKLKGGLDLEQQLTWQEDPYQVLRQQLAEQAQQNAWGDISLPLFHQGQSVLMARFGLLHWQTSQGEWQKIKLPTNAQLTAAVDASDWVAVGAERGQLFLAKTPTSEWTRLQPVNAAEAIVWMRAGADRFYAMTKSATAYNVYQFTAPDAAWQRIGNFKHKSGGFLVQYGGVFAFLNQQGQLQVLNDTELHRFDPASASWQQQKAQAMVKLSQQRDGTLLGLAVSQWDGIGDQLISQDFGQSWQTLHRSLGLFDDRALEATLAAKLANGRLVTISRERQNNQKQSNLRLMVADVASATTKAGWQSAGKIQEGCSTLLPELTYEQTLYMLCNEGDVIRTSDLGQTWQTVIDIDIPALQQTYERLTSALANEN